MTSSQKAVGTVPPWKRGAFLTALTIAIALSVAGCTLMLLLPTASVTVDAVYQGF